MTESTVPERAEFGVYCVKLSGHDTQFIMQCEIQFGHGFMTVAQQCNSAEHWQVAGAWT